MLSPQTVQRQFSASVLRHGPRLPGRGQLLTVQVRGHVAFAERDVRPDVQADQSARWLIEGVPSRSIGEARAKRDFSAPRRPHDVRFSARRGEVKVRELGRAFAGLRALFSSMAERPRYHFRIGRWARIRVRVIGRASVPYARQQQRSVAESSAD